MIYLTYAAAEKVKQLLAENNVNTNTGGMRIGILGGGCGGLKYFLKPETKPQENDEIFETKGAKLFLDQELLPYLEETTIDYGPTRHSIDKDFIFNNPNAGSTCGCGTSFTPKDWEK